MGVKDKINKIEIPVGSEFMYKDMRVIAQAGGSCDRCVFYRACGGGFPLVCMGEDRKDRTNVTFVEVPKEKPRQEFKIDKLVLPLDMVIYIDGEAATVSEDDEWNACKDCMLKPVCEATSGIGHPACHWAIRPDEKGVRFVKIEK
jgi:hypothetical protein